MFNKPAWAKTQDQYIYVQLSRHYSWKRNSVAQIDDFFTWRYGQYEPVCNTSFLQLDMAYREEVECRFGCMLMMAEQHPLPWSCRCDRPCSAVSLTQLHPDFSELFVCKSMRNVALAHPHIWLVVGHVGTYLYRDPFSGKWTGPWFSCQFGYCIVFVLNGLRSQSYIWEPHS